jgi:hypothetical protein
MKRLILTAALLATACAGGPRGPQRPLAANPSAAVAAELAFARLAQERGQWAAFRETAAPDAEMFVPERVKAQDWLRGRAEPPVAVAWQPYQVWTSCDGTVAVTHGAWQSPNATGYFTTVWLRQNDGRFKWVLDHGDALPSPLPAPEMIAARVADCTSRPGVPLTAPAVGEDMKVGASRDQSLIWSSTVAADGSRVIVVKTWNGTAHETVIEEMVLPEKP